MNLQLHRRRWAPAHDALLRQEYSAASALALARKLGRSERSIRGRAAKLGLTVVGNVGVPFVRQAARRRLAADHGWPAEITPREVQILDLLYSLGPHSRQQICQAIGLPWRGSRRSLCDRHVPGGNYLAHLMRLKLVIRLPRTAVGPGKGNSVHLYAIAPHVIRTLPHGRHHQQEEKRQ